MSKLVPCKSCKHEVSKTANSCPNCGEKSPGISSKDHLIGCMSIIVVAIILVLWVTLSSVEDNANQTTSVTDEISGSANGPASSIVENKEAIDVVDLTDENLKNHLTALMNDYIDNAQLLMDKYQAMKDRPRENFISWRNNDWVPEIQDKEDHYQRLIENNRKYFNDSQQFHLVSVFGSITELKIISLDFMISIRDKDEDSFISGQNRLKEQLTMLNETAKKYGIEI